MHVINRKLSLCFILSFLWFAYSCHQVASFTEDKKGQSDHIPPRSEKAIMSKNGFNSGLLDRHGQLWIGSNGGGIYNYDGETFQHFTQKNGLNSNQVFAILEDKAGNLWFGTAKGLCKYDRKTFVNVPIPFQDTTSLWLDKAYPIINPNAVHSLSQDKKGQIWIGTAGGGAYVYDGLKFTSHLAEIGQKQEDSLYHNWIPSIREDAAGNIWFASMTHGGVSRFDGQDFVHFSIQDGLSDDMIRTIYKDEAGNLWFGSNGNRNSGLTVYDGLSFKTFTKNDGLCNTNITAIYEDKRGQIWLGSGRGNLCIFDGQNFKEMQTKAGESFSNVLFILQDKEEKLWFGGIHGLWKYDKGVAIDMTNKTPN